MNESFELPDVDHFAPLAVGPPGQRVFYLQARQGDVVLTLRAEKQHVAALAQHFSAFLTDLPPADEIPPPGAPAPTEPAWVAGNVALSYDEDADRILVEIEELVVDDEEEEPDDDEAAGAVARLGISRGLAAAFARDGAELVAAGRPACPLCGHPMDPEGHVCPRSNGHSRPGR